MRLSCVTSVFNTYSIFDAVDAIANAGYEAIDVWAGRPQLYRSDYSAAELTRLATALSERHLAVPSVLPAFFRYPHSLSSPNDNVRGDSIDYMRQSIDNAVALGAEIVLIVPSRTLHGQTQEDAWQRLTDSIAQVCAYAEQYDLWLGIEPANKFVTDLLLFSTDARRIIDLIRFPRLGVVMDCGHINLTKEKVEDIIACLGPLLLEWHVNDNDGFHQQNKIPGEGTFNFKQFVETLRKSNYQGFLSVELGWDYSFEPEPAVAKALAYMRTILD